MDKAKVFISNFIKSKFFSFFVLLLFYFVFIGCLPSALEAQYSWSGTTNQSKAMSFTVSADGSQWSNFVLSHGWSSGGASGTITFTTPGPGNIVNGQFSGGGGTFTFTGQFSTTTASNGTYTITNHPVVIGLPYPPYVQTIYISGSGTWNATGTLPAMAPGVTTGSASSITINSATLSGTVNPNGTSTSYYFEYGLDTSYGSTSSSVGAGTGFSPVSVNASISGLVQNTLYHYRLVATNTGGTTYGGDMTFSTLAPPTVTTGVASSVTTNSATLNGTVNPNGKSTNYHFEYGLTTSYGTTTAAQSAGSGTADVPVTEPISGLSQNTFHYRLVATNADGTTYGSDMTFTTLAPPNVTTGVASSVTTNSATLNGTVNPNGKSTNYYFEYGLTTSYGTTTTAQSAGSGTTDVPVNEPVSGLSSNTTYHYRLVATNADGTTYGGDQTFNTGTTAKTWSGIKRLTWNSGESCLPGIAADSSSHVHIVWYDNSPGNEEILYKGSTDSGSTWGPINRITWNSGSSKKPVAAADSSGNVHMAWYDDSNGNFEILYKKSTNNGSTWGPINRMTWNAGSSVNPALALSSGYVHLIWNDNSPGNDEIIYKRSTDGGSTWGPLNRLTWNGGDSKSPAIAADAGNNVYVAWYDNTYGNDEILYKRSTDGGSTWGGITRITWNGGSSVMPYLAVDSSSGVYLVWNDNSSGNDEILYKSSGDSGASWGPIQRMTWNSGASLKPVVAADPGNNVHISWCDNTPGDYEIYYKQSTDGGTTWGALFRLTWNSGSSAAPAIAVDAGGNVYLTWEDNTPGNCEIYNKNKK